MRIIWDERKRIANIEKHGLDFEDVFFFQWENAVIEKVRSGRVKAIGYFLDGTAVVIFARLGTEAISVISFRPANIREKRLLR